MESELAKVIFISNFSTISFLLEFFFNILSISVFEEEGDQLWGSRGKLAVRRNRSGQGSYVDHL